MNGRVASFTNPTTWKADLATGAAAFDAAFSTAASADDSKVASTAEIKQKINEAMQLKRTIGFMIPNVPREGGHRSDTNKPVITNEIRWIFNDDRC